MLKLPAVAITALILLIAAVGASAQEAHKAATVSALEALDMLTQDPKSTFLVDVRSRAEYTLMGHAPQAYNVPWRFLTDDFQVEGGSYQGGKAPYTGYQLSAKSNPNFAGVMQSLFKPEDRIIIISTSGIQGAQASDALAESGFKRIYNIRHGFMGDPLTSKEQGKLAQKHSPSHGRLGRVNGWVYWDLPVTYRIDPRRVYPPDIKRMNTSK